MDRNGSQKAPAVPARATQGAEARDWSWVEDTVWTERMLSALVNGVKGGRWYSLMDKVFAPDTLEAAWEKVLANDGAAGVDGQSIKRFEARAELYLTELSTALRNGSYQPQPIRRVEIPKVMDGRARWESRRSGTASPRRRGSWHSSRSLRRRSDRRAMASGRDGAAWMRCAKWLS